MYVNKFFLADALYSKNFGRKNKKNAENFSTKALAIKVVLFTIW